MKNKVVNFILIVGAAGMIGCFAGLFINKLFLDMNQEKVQYFIDMEKKGYEIDLCNPVFAGDEGKNLLYDLSLEYMKQNLSVNRTKFTISDNTDYNIWKLNHMPLYGAYCSSSRLDDITYIDDTVDSDMASYFRQHLNLVPDGLEKILRDEGWEFRLTNFMDIDDGSEIKTYGYTDFENKTINFVADSYKIHKSFFHELGHIVERHSRNELETNGIIDIQYDELQNVYLHWANGSPYLYMNYNEIMAELYNEYIFFPVELYEQAPTIYSIIDKTS